jgi:hypothetical protein
MQYYVVNADGEKYGPADVATLSQWAVEGRIDRESILESAQDASRVSAGSVPGIFAGTAGPGTTFQAPQTFSGYPRPNSMSGTGDNEVKLAWILGGIGFASHFVCCLGCLGWPLSIAGLVLAILAHQKGNEKAMAALIFCAVSLVLGGAGGLFVRPMLTHYFTPRF